MIVSDMFNSCSWNVMIKFETVEGNALEGHNVVSLEVRRQAVDVN